MIFFAFKFDGFSMPCTNRIKLMGHSKTQKWERLFNLGSTNLFQSRNSFM